MAGFDLRQFPNAQSLAEAAGEDWLREISETDSSKGFCTALSGGRIARTFFSAAVLQTNARRLSLRGVHFFWSDERCVPPEDPESNFRDANDLLLRPLQIPESQIHRVRGENPPEQAATDAEAELRRVAASSVGDQPVLDLVFLGMGEDGHTASLFPGEPQDVMGQRAVFRCVTAVKPPPRRITMGYPVLSVASRVWVLASGAGKEAALRESLKPNGHTPLARLLSMRSSTRIYSDCDI